MIEAARGQAFHAVNTALLDLYWNVGAYIHRKIEAAEWGDGVVAQLAAYIASRHPEIKGFNRRNLFRMRQFYAVYRTDEKVAALPRQLSWTQNLAIMSKCKSQEEREFYLQMTLRERWSSRELDRQIDACLFERQILAPAKVSAVLTQLYPSAPQLFKDSYLLDFLDLPEPFDERDLHQGLVANLKRFLLELGRDFCFVGEQCKSKDSEVVEYALSRTLLPALVAEYETKLPARRLLQDKLHELLQIAEAAGEYRTRRPTRKGAANP